MGKEVDSDLNIFITVSERMTIYLLHRRPAQVLEALSLFIHPKQ
jgi:hypothetical protein